jgi:signal peptidase I
MKTCPRCGFHHIDADQRCVRCGTRLDPLGQIVVDPLSDAKPERGPAKVSRWAALANGPMRLAGWGRLTLARWRRRLIDPMPNPHETILPGPWAAAAPGLLWPGLGQLRCRQPRKAAWFALGWAACLATAAATFFKFYSNWVLLGCVAYWVLAWHDAFVTALRNRLLGDPIPWQKRLAYLGAWFWYVGIFCMLFIWAGYWTVLQRKQVYHRDLAPWLSRGEWFLAERATYLWRRPRLGDVVYYSPPSLKMEQIGSEENFDPSSVSIKPVSMIERIVAMPGQTLEYRDGAFWRDGKPVPAGECPLVTGQIGPFRMTCQPGHYLILFSYLGAEGEPLPIISANVEGGTIPTRLNQPGWVVVGWEKACQVPFDQVWGRPWLVYNPPPSRRFLD